MLFEVSTCRDFRTLPSSEWCEFTNITADCDQDEGFVDYISGAFCGFPVENGSNVLILVYVVYILWIGFSLHHQSIQYFDRPGNLMTDDYFVPAVEYFAAFLKLSENIAGITFVALGNGAPDIFGAMAAFTSATPETSSLAIGALLGAGAFIRLVVAGACIWISPIQVPHRETMRDIIFSVVAIYWLFLCIWKERISNVDSFGFLGLYALYILVVIAMSLWDKRKESGIENVNHDQQDDVPEVESRSTAGSTHDQLEDSADHVNVLTDYGKTDATTYRRALTFLFPLTIWVLTYQYNKPYVGACPNVVIYLASSTVAAGVIFLTSKLESLVFQFAGFAICIVWIYAICNEIVNILAALGVFWNVSNTIMVTVMKKSGILILAPANSIGDYVADTALAKNGKFATAFGAVYSGPLLNLLVGIGLSCTISTLANGMPVPLARTAVELSCAATVEYALISSMIILVACNFHFKKWTGIFFLVSYAICLGIILAAGLNAFGSLPQ